MPRPDGVSMLLPATTTTVPLTTVRSGWAKVRETGHDNPRVSQGASFSREMLKGSNISISIKRKQGRVRGRARENQACPGPAPAMAQGAVQDPERLLSEEDAQGRPWAGGRSRARAGGPLGYRRFLGAKRMWERGTTGSGDRTAEPLHLPLAVCPEAARPRPCP